MNRLLRLTRLPQSLIITFLIDRKQRLEYEATMSDIQHNLQAAIELHQTGDLKAAEPLYQQVLTAVPHHLEAMYLPATPRFAGYKFWGCARIDD